MKRRRIELTQVKTTFADYANLILDCACGHEMIIICTEWAQKRKKTSASKTESENSE